MPKKESKTIDLEKSLVELEAVVERLEGGELGLEQALKEFERGVKLTRECQAALRPPKSTQFPFARDFSS